MFQEQLADAYINSVASFAQVLEWAKSRNIESALCFHIFLVWKQPHSTYRRSTRYSAKSLCRNEVSL